VKKEKKSNGEVDNLPQEISNRKSPTSVSRERKYESLTNSLLKANPSTNIPSENFELNMNHRYDQNNDSGNVMKASEDKQVKFSSILLDLLKKMVSITLLYL